MTIHPVLEITDFQKIADGFILMTASLAKEVEKEKLKAIGARNLLKSVAKQREAEQQQLQVGVTKIIPCIILTFFPQDDYCFHYTIA